MTLLDAEVSLHYRIKDISKKDPSWRRRLLDMGFSPSTVIFVNGLAPFGKTILIALRGTLIALREDAASLIEIEPHTGEC